MNTKKLSSELWVFLQDILTKIDAYKKSGKMPLNNRVFVQTKVSQFSYNKGGVGFTSHDEYIVKTEWDWKDRLDFVTKSLTENPSYKSIISQIAQQYSVPEAQTEFWIRRLVDVITGNEEEKPPDEKIVDYIAAFIADLEKTPVYWRITIWVNGFWVRDTTPIKINEEISIRQVTATDLENERPFESLRFEGMYNNHASAIIEINRRFKDQPEVQDYIETLTNALRLFRLGSVSSVKQAMMVDSIINFGSTSGFGLNLTGTAYMYELIPTDTDKLMSITDLIFAKNKAIKIFDTQADATNPIGIGLKRYNNAVLKSGTDEERIASVVSCLEALFLKSHERSELSHRLSQRAAILLKQFDLRPKKVYDDLDRAYLIRSTYSHGSFVNPEEHKDIPELTRRVLEYARLSLLVFIQFAGTTEKEKLINKLENAMLEETALTALKDLVGSNCKHYR
jgi:hypothetical protein